MNPERYQTRRYVMRPETSWEDAKPFAEAFNWSLASSTARDRDEGVDGQVIWQGDDVAALHYIEDAPSGIGYFVLTGEQERTVEALAAQAAEMLKPWTLDDIFADFDDAADAQERAQRILRVGLAAPSEFHQGVFDRIKNMLSDSDPRVRYAALWATTYAGYPEFVPLIEDVVASDPEDWVRDHAEAVLSAYGSEGD
jgi:hypothetical protein